MRPLSALLSLLLLSSCAAGRAIREGDDWMEKERPEAAVRAYADGLEKKPDHTRLQLRIARAYLASGQPDRALEPARSAYEAGEPQSGEVLALALIRTHQWQEAIPLLTDALIDEDRPELYAALAEARLSTGQNDLAIESAQEAVKGDPSYGAFLAYLLARDGQLQEARELALSAQASGSSDPNILAEAAVVLYMAKAEVGYRAAASSAAQLGGDEMIAEWARSAEEEHKAGGVEVALRLGMRAFVVNQEDPRLPWTVGVWWLEAGEPMLAIDLLYRAYNHPDYDPGRQEALEVYKTSGLTYDDRLRAHLAIGVALADAYRALGSPRDEAEILSKTLESVPNAALYLRLSDVLLAVGRPMEANKAAQMALQTDPGNNVAAVRLARAYAAMGDRDAALRYGVRALELSPDDPEIALLLSKLYEELDDERTAADILRAALRSNPNHPELQAALSRLQNR